jgi:erythromycin esterase-like protein
MIDMNRMALLMVCLFLLPMTAQGQEGTGEETGDMAAGQLAEELRDMVIPLTGTQDYGALLDDIGDARVVLIGEASHGTHEFYQARAEITRRLIEDKGFNAVAAEADFPSAARVNDYVHGLGADQDAEQALRSFERFPTWMWRNTDVQTFVEWLRDHNTALPADQQEGFYGLDLYSLHESMNAVIAYLDQVDPAAAQRARYRYGCFEVFGEDPQAYGYSASIDMDERCQAEVEAQLNDLRRSRQELMSKRGQQDVFFYTEQNARVVVNAELYYRALYTGSVNTWNFRDTHMMETLEALVAHLQQTQGSARVVVWAHNSHVGDMRASELGERGELNIGQLARERYGDDAYLIGFSTYTGTVAAAHDWDAPMQIMDVRPALEGSQERLFHNVGIPAFLLLLDERAALAALSEPRLERAIGVIYRPTTERLSHYFQARLRERFDALIHFDTTSAVTPLDMTQPQTDEPPETYPTGV